MDETAEAPVSALVEKSNRTPAVQYTTLTQYSFEQKADKIK